MLNSMRIPNQISSTLIFQSTFKLCTNSNPKPKILKLGDTLQQSRVFTNDDVVNYSNLTSDFNPLHFDSDSATNAGFDDCIVHGMLVSSLFPRIIATHFPGAVYVSQSLHFKQPVYIGEEICAAVEAIAIRDFKKKHMVKFSTKCFKQGGVLVLDGEATTILPTMDFE